MKTNLHSFIICTYKENPYLEECIQSLKNQKKTSPIYISTSTPNQYVKKLAKKYNIKMYINENSTGHADDFNYAFKISTTKYVTLCHQDDLYLPEFSQKVIKKMESSKKVLFSFTNYYELKNNKIIKNNLVLFIKRIMNFPYQSNLFNGFHWVKKINLSLGNSISAPTVTFNTERLNRAIVNTNFKSNIDWISWIEYSKLKGKFMYISKPLLIHRINEFSTTTKVIQDNTKKQEDIQIFRMFWPNFITKILIKFYSISEKNNNLREEKEENSCKSC